MSPAGWLAGSTPRSQLLVLEHHRLPLPASSPPAPQTTHARTAPAHTPLRRVPLLQHLLPLRFRQQRQLTHPLLRILDHPLQQPRKCPAIRSIVSPSYRSGAYSSLSCAVPPPLLSAPASVELRHRPGSTAYALNSQSLQLQLPPLGVFCQREHHLKQRDWLRFRSGCNSSTSFSNGTS